MNDIHTHLYWQSYDADRDAVVARARAAGVEKILVIGCTVEESKQAIALTEQYPDMYAAVGVHPHFFNDAVEKEYAHPKPQSGLGFGMAVVSQCIDELRVLALYKKVVAIGECGLDYYAHETGTKVGDTHKAVQKAGFLAQIALAQELSLPLILHCRPSIGTQDAYEDMFLILKSKIVNLKSAVLHCYMGDTEITKKFLTLPNVYFSFTGNITYPVKKSVAGTKNDLTETVKLIPLDRIFTETDCPFLTPQSHRGERNEPAFVTEVAEKIAELHSVSEAEVIQATEENFTKVFTKNG